MAFIVIYDANVLYPNTLRDLLIRIAQQPHLVQAKWSDQIIDETLRALQKNRPDITEEKAARLREPINGAVRDCLVTGYQPLIEALELSDPDDRHVLTAAIKVNAQLVVGIRRYPHDSFSRAIRSTSDRTFRCVAGRPDRPRRDNRAHRRRTMSRRQRKIVPGATISRIAARRSVGTVPASRASHARSGHVKRE
jgi:hypothetical protein